MNGQLTYCFEVHVGLRQGCLLSSTLFNIFQDFVMKELIELDQTKAPADSTNISCTDDTNLPSTIFVNLKGSMKQPHQACKKWGMKINDAKYKIISQASNP